MVPIVEKNQVEKKKNSRYPVLYSPSNKIFLIGFPSIDKQNPKEKGIRGILYFPIIIHVKFPYWK